MKTLCILQLAFVLVLLGGCEFSSTKVKVRIVEHKLEVGGKFYVLLCEVLEPKNLAGCYHVAATRKTDLVASIDGGAYEIALNFTMIRALSQNKRKRHAGPRMKRVAA